MILKYVKIEEDWDDLKDGSSVIFDLPTSKIYYEIYNSPSSKYWWLVNDDFNGQIFDELEINGKSLVESVVRYDCSGGFPEVEDLNDLKAVIKALDDECIKKFGTPDSKSKVEDSDSKEEYIHPSKLKNGDFIKIRTGDHKGFIYIFKEYKDNSIYRYVSLDLVDNSLDTDSSRKWGIFFSSDKITYATKEESKLLLEALAKKGYYWDFCTNTLVLLDSFTLAKSISVDTVQPITNPYKTTINLFNPNSKQEDFNELNLFPTKKHYQLNFNY